MRTQLQSETVTMETLEVRVSAKTKVSMSNLRLQGETKMYSGRSRDEPSSERQNQQTGHVSNGQRSTAATVREFSTTVQLNRDGTGSTQSVLLGVSSVSIQVLQCNVL